jgi:putative transcriptional regulator
MANVRLLCLVLICGLAGPGFGADVASMKSILLVARKDLPDPFFRESVVLITQSAGGTPIGLIVNRPTDVPLSRVFPDVEALSSRDEKLFFGGPVMPEQLVAVFRAAAPRTGALEVLEGVYMSSTRDVFRELLARDNPVDGLRVFAGYAGWAPGQLEAEVARGDWHLTAADARTLFGLKPDSLWRELERRASAKKSLFIPSSSEARARGPASP